MADIETVKKGCEVCIKTNCAECPYNSGDMDCMNGIFKDALAVIEQLEKTVEDQAERIAIMEAEMLGWIDISEQQPTEDDRDILVISEGEVCFCTHYFSNNKHEYETPDIFESFPITHITHWMRLPKPPKEGGGN